VADGATCQKNVIGMSSRLQVSQIKISVYP
jgi:hypothetical protein